MAQLYDDGRVNTIHLQTGPTVYIFESDEILPNDEFLLDKVKQYQEVQGTAQGQGIETIWWDTSEEPIDAGSTAEQLKQRAAFVRSLGSMGAKEKPIVVKVTRPRGKHRG